MKFEDKQFIAHFGHDAFANRFFSKVDRARDEAQYNGRTCPICNSFVNDWGCPSCEPETAGDSDEDSFTILNTTSHECSKFLVNASRSEEQTPTTGDTRGKEKSDKESSESTSKEVGSEKRCEAASES